MIIITFACPKCAPFSTRDPFIIIPCAYGVGKKVIYCTGVILRTDGAVNVSGPPGEPKIIMRCAVGPTGSGLKP